MWSALELKILMGQGLEASVLGTAVHGAISRKRTMEQLYLHLYGGRARETVFSRAEERPLRGHTNLFASIDDIGWFSDRDVIASLRQCGKRGLVQKFLEARLGELFVRDELSRAPADPDRPRYLTVPALYADRHS